LGLFPLNRHRDIVRCFVQSTRRVEYKRDLFGQVSAPGTPQRWDIACRLGGFTTMVEYDVDEHYRHSIKIKGDRTKDQLARATGFRVIRFPYWIQLDSLALQHFFGMTAKIEQSFPHGFHHYKAVSSIVGQRS
jgi:hypothetical protein